MQAMKQKQNQDFLFSEPSYSETGVWCKLNEEIDPSHWAYLCRCLGKMNAKDFKKARKKILGNPDSLWRRLKSIFEFKQEECDGLPLVKCGYLEKV